MAHPFGHGSLCVIQKDRPETAQAHRNWLSAEHHNVGKGLIHALIPETR